MMSINPHIPSPDTMITGERVNLPSINMPEAENRIFGEFCPPVPESEFLPSGFRSLPPNRWLKPNTMYSLSGQDAGGGAALWRLCEQWGNNGKKIGIVERGDISLPTHVNEYSDNKRRNFRFYAPSSNN